MPNNETIERLCRDHDLMTRGTDIPNENAVAALSEMRGIALKEAAEIAIGEKVDYEWTREEGDEAYNQACEHIQAAILARLVDPL